ncbi:UNVERIFIED_CONTAM: hypothetical protein H355_005390, partial [Colinus virginianus]
FELNCLNLQILFNCIFAIPPLVEKNPRTGNLGSLIKVFLSRTKELKISAECQNHLFIWQAHNALFIICCLLKVFISRMSEEELQLHFTYEDKTPGSYGGYLLLNLSGTDGTCVLPFRTPCEIGSMQAIVKLAFFFRVWNN